MDAFLDAWFRGVYPLRRRFGFTFAGVWRVEDAVNEMMRSVLPD